MLIEKVINLYNEYNKQWHTYPNFLYMDHKTKYDFYNEYYNKMPNEYRFNSSITNYPKFYGMEIQTVKIHSDTNLIYISVINESLNFNKYSDYRNGSGSLLADIHNAKDNYIKKYNKIPNNIYVNRFISLILMRDLKLIKDPKFFNMRIEFMNVFVRDLVFKGGQQVNFMLE